MKRKIVFLVMVVAMALALACQAPKTRSVIINSEPQGATILINGEIVGQTPMKRDIVFKREKDRHLIQIRKKGYETQERYYYYRDEENILFQMDPQ